MAKEVDWQSLKEEYVYGYQGDGGISYPLQKTLAEKYGVEQSYLSTKIREEGWKEEKEEFRAKVERQIALRTMEEVATKIVKVESVSSDLSLWGLETCKEIGESVKENAKVEGTPVNLKSLETLAKTMLTFKRLSAPVIEPKYNEREKLTMVGEVIDVKQIMEKLPEASESELFGMLEQIYGRKLLKEAEEVSFTEESIDDT